MGQEKRGSESRAELLSAWLSSMVDGHCGFLGPWRHLPTCDAVVRYDALRCLF
ncbi:hypothetical protein RB213_011793 [Colletotrichum asianum]